MGSNLANEMADGTLSDMGIVLTLEQQMEIQLTSNHYPPVPKSMIGPCIEAINACNEEEPNRLITLPEGVYWRNKTEAPAWAIIDGHHLDAWVNVYDFEEEYE